MAKRSLLREDFRGSDRTLVSSSLDSNNSSRSNVHAYASSSYYTNSNNDIGADEEEEDEDEEDDEGRQRPEELESDKGIWEKTSHYVLLGFGTVFGVRNILKFPALAIEHGGGAFVFTYVFLTFTVGVPIVYLEVSLGQYARGGVVKAWRMIPLTKGLGLCSLLLSLARTSYSSTPAAWALYYFYSAMSGNQPFRKVNLEVEILGSVSYNSSANMSSEQTSALYRASYARFNRSFFSATLEMTDSISNMGHLVPHIITSLLVIWFFVFLLSAIGPRMLGKIALSFTAVPSVLIIILLIAASTMSGSVLGIQAFLSPKWHNLSTIKPWIDAFDLVLSSLACGTGVLVTLSGQCPFQGNTFRNAMIMTGVSLAMTIVSGCLLLSLVGVESKLLGVRVETLPRFTDVDLGFVLFPAVTSHLPASAIWSCIFFLLIVLLSLVQAATMVQHIQQGMVEVAHLQDIKFQWKMAILGTISVIMMSLNVLTTSENGLHVLRLLQFSVPRLTVPLLCVAETMTIGWGYGARRFAGRITEMTGRNKSFVWKWLWRWGCPVSLTLISIASILTTNLLEDLPLVDAHQKWIYFLGWSINPIILFPGLVIASVSFCRAHGTFKQRLKQLRTTPSSWGPGHPEHEPQADLPDYVICQPDPFRPANALAMLTANLYLPNIVNFVNMQPPSADTDLGPDYMSDMATLTSSEDDNSIDNPVSKDSCIGRWHATVPCLSQVIGMGNVVRFPYLAYRHGGGAFVIAYVVVLITVGVPLIIIETAIGQFSSLGPVSVWRAVPVFKGIGYSMMVISVATTIYYSVVTSWSVFYLATSLTSVMPWRGCHNSWNTNSCSTAPLTYTICTNVSSNETSFKPCDQGTEDCVKPNVTVNSLCHDINRTDVNLNLDNTSVRSAEEYFYFSVVKQSDSFLHAGELRWQLCLCLLTTWTIIFIFLIKGFKPGGKTTYLFLILTALALIILLVRSSSLPGGHDGLSFLFTLQWSKLMEGEVWRDATSQVFFSMSIGCGSLVAMGTFNKFSNNVIREAALLCIVDTGMSVLCSLVVFAVLGTLARAAHTEIEHAARADIGLTFVTFSRAVLTLPWPFFWSILVFIVVALSGTLTCITAMSTAISSLVDVYSSLFKKHKKWMMLALCLTLFFLGIPMTLQVGFHIVSILDTFLSGLPQMCVGGATVVAFTWIYGIGRLCSDVSRMINSQIGWWWKLIWAVVCPSITAILIVSSFVSVISSEEDETHPWWLNLIGLLFWLMTLVPIFVGIIHEISQAKNGTFLEKVRRACQPRKGWGATLHRCNSNVEYYPTVHTHLGIDISREGLSTVADHVQFTPVGVHVPSLSQTTLLPVSPGTPKSKKPMDMRHKAILNHAYSNPQCHVSSGSLERLSKKARPASISLANEELQDVIVTKKTKQKVSTHDAFTQTDQSWAESKLCRQSSQPIVSVTKRIPVLRRSSSWHQLGGQPAVLSVCAKQLSCAKPKATQSKPTESLAQRRRRFGQSMAPNLRLLIGQEISALNTKPINYPLPSAITMTNEAPLRVGCVLIAPSDSPTQPKQWMNSLRFKTSIVSEDGALPSPLALKYDPVVTAVPLTRQKAPAINTAVPKRRRRTLRESKINRDIKSQSMEETSISSRQKLFDESNYINNRYILTRADSDGISRCKSRSASLRTKSESDEVTVVKMTRKCSLSSRPQQLIPVKTRNRSKSFSCKGGSIIMEEELDPQIDEIRDDFRTCLQMIHAETEMSKL
ncbi:uncharacterized protein LOC106067429 isoform X4 [Biomphalaria glabrata]|nr:uncharacterized protein LOC106067429 isoform X4 [Biomphalaria glabrata]XP_055893974.1 uncharacterized protein LOC106067429 isoform X4 [Biomphalaria glabrata]XP_055893975.1 uncharacterized protein LOC106067429 isoform X4 [Biomphalaria glabrata]